MDKVEGRESTAKITEELVRAANEAYARIPLSNFRARELPIELDQFASVAEKVRVRLQFDDEVADFERVLEELAWKE